jgi:hypothetical protein
MKQRNLTDTTLINRDFVCLEVWPLGSLTSLKIEDWQFKIDEENTLPAWFSEEEHLWQTRAIEEVLNIVKAIRCSGIFTGSLDLRGTQVEDLGNLTECGSLDLRGTQVEDLGNLTECGSLDLRGTQVKDLRNLKKVTGSLDLQDTQVEDLGKLKKVTGYFDLRGTQVKDLGNLTECGSLYLQSSQVKKMNIPKKFKEKILIG